MSDRKALIRLASALPKGSNERKAILAGLQGGKFRPDPKLYLQDDECPYCGAPRSDWKAGGDSQHECGNCLAIWGDVTKLIGIDVVRGPQVEVEELPYPPEKGSPMSRGR